MKTIITALCVCGLSLGLIRCDKSASQNQSATGDSVALASLTPDSLTKPVFKEVTEPQVSIDLDEIRKRGRLVALTGYSANSYFVYKGETMGFEYELLSLLAEHLHLHLDIVIVKNLDQIFSMLNEGKGDIIAYNMTITKKRRKKVMFTDNHSLIRQVLVQRLPDNWRQMKRHQIEKKLLRSPVELIGKKVHVRKGSSYYARLVNLSDEIGGDIDIVEVPGDVSTEELIARVASGEIEYTVADENVALVNAAYLHNIDIGTPVSLPQQLAWAVRKNSPKLRDAINEWLADIKRAPTYNILYAKYYQNKRFFAQRVKSEFFTLTGDKISPYDDLIKAKAQQINWDWRLLAAQIYQESQFDPRAKSWAGARGLLQLMPRTAKEFGAKRVTDPEQNITAGTRYLAWLWNYWKEIPDSVERLKFVLGSYNAGQGHVEDARRLAIKNGKDPKRWDNVADFLLKKAQKAYFNDDVVQFGYCRGEEPVAYVEDIFDRYHHYQKFVSQ